MKILLTGATGYIGKRLLPILIGQGHQVVCCVRDVKRFNPPESLKKRIEVIEVDFLNSKSLNRIPKDIDGAYYLMHSMSNSKNYMDLEVLSAENFRKTINESTAQHVIYLSGIVNEHYLSPHLASRLKVENELVQGKYNFTALRAGIIIGSGSASFEIIRDLVEKLPVMITPKWLHTKCQPIGVKDVISFLSQTLFKKECYNENYDIGGPDVISYKEMLLGYAKARGLKRTIAVVPVMTPKLSSYWLYFVTSTSYKLAVALVHSMKIEVICRNNELAELLDISTINYQDALSRTLQKIEGHQIISSWKDSFISGRFDFNISEFLNVPTFGCFIDSRQRRVNNKHRTIDKIWRIGGNSGWYYATVLWQIRGFMDKLLGGVGLRRGRTHEDRLAAGDTVDFWRVLYADKEEGRLLLFAEMKLPGEAWLELKVKDGVLHQTATFRPKGVLGRLYWFSVLPFHGIVFSGLLKQLTK